MYKNKIFVSHFKDLYNHAPRNTHLVTRKSDLKVTHSNSAQLKAALLRYFGSPREPSKGGVDKERSD